MKTNWHLGRISLFTLIACASGGKALLPPATHTKAAAGPSVANIVTKEYQFEMPDIIPAGPTLFYLSDEGNQLRRVTLVKL